MKDNTKGPKKLKPFVAPMLVLLVSFLLFAKWKIDSKPDQKIDLSSTIETDRESNSKNPVENSKNQSERQTASTISTKKSSAKDSSKSNSKPRLNNAEIKEKLLVFFDNQGRGSWNVLTNEEGKIFRVIGGKIPKVGRSEEDFLSFMEDLAPNLGIPPDQVNQKVVEDTTRNLRIYDSVQHMEGYEVYQGWFRVLSNINTHEGIIFNNSLKPIDPAIDTSAEMTITEAQEIVKNEYRDKFSSFINYKGPLIWADKLPHQLAYQFNVQLKNDTLEVIVGIQSKLVIHSHSTVLH